MNEWENFGDVNFFDYGGVMVKNCSTEASIPEYEFFYLITGNSDVKYAFHGSILWLSDYLDTLQAEAAEMGYETAQQWILENPESAAAWLVENYGTGPFEFSPRNHNGVGEYSMDYRDFQISEEELGAFMKSVGIPDEYIPEMYRIEPDMEKE